MFDKESYISFLLDQKVIGFFDNPIKLKSGRLSSFYINMRRITEDVYATEKLATFLISYIHHLLEVGSVTVQPKTIFGVPEGATKLGVITQYLYAKSSTDFAPGSHPLCMGRGKRKEHGLPEDRDFLGTPRGATIVIEDVTTTGGSLINCIKSLLEVGVNVICSICLVDRGEKSNDLLMVEDGVMAISISSKHVIRHFPLVTSYEILPKAIKLLKPPAHIIDSIVREFDEYGREPLKT